MLSTLPLHCAEVTAPNSNARELLTLSSDDDGKEMSIEDAVDILSATSLAPAPSAYYRTKKARVSCPCRNSKCKHTPGRHTVAGRTTSWSQRPISSCLSVSDAEVDVSNDGGFLTEKRDCKPSDALVNPYVHTGIPRLPSSEAETLRLEFIDVIQGSNLDYSWYRLVPPYVSTDKGVDAVTKAVVHARTSQLRGDTRSTALATRSYSEAIETVRRSLSLSDQSLLAAALLSLYEYIMRSDIKAAFAHDEGVNAIIRARGSSAPASDLFRALLYRVDFHAFHRSCCLGEPSPFEARALIEPEPSVGRTASAEATKSLRKISHELFVWLPRLIANVRLLRTEDRSTSSSCDVSQSKTIALMMRLLHLEDPASESALLHAVRVVETVRLQDREVFPYSFEFADLDQYEAALMYWIGKVLLNRLCLKMMEIGVELEGTELISERLQSEQMRFATNIIMAWQYSYRNGPSIGRSRPMPLTSLATWTALLNAPSTFRGKPIADIRKAVLRRFHEGAVQWPVQLDAADLDEAADMYAGGPLKGVAISLYQNGRYKM